MKKLLIAALLIAGCGDQASGLDMDEPDMVDLGSDIIEKYEPQTGQGPGGIQLPPCARPDIDQCLGPPSRSDVLKRPVEMPTEKVFE